MLAGRGDLPPRGVPMAGPLQHHTTALPLPLFQPRRLREEPDNHYAARSCLTTNPVSTTWGARPPTSRRGTRGELRTSLPMALRQRHLDADHPRSRAPRAHRSPLPIQPHRPQRARHLPRWPDREKNRRPRQLPPTQSWAEDRRRRRTPRRRRPQHINMRLVTEDSITCEIQNLDHAGTHGFRILPQGSQTY